MENCSAFTEFSTCGNLTKFDDSCALIPWKILVDWFANKLPPPIIAISIGTNIFTVCVCLRQNLRQLNSVVVYLMSLAISDLVHLVTDVVSQQFGKERDGKYTWTVSACKLGTYFYMLSAAMSPLILVAYSVERLLAVRFPFIKMKTCYPRKAVYSLCSILVIAGLLYMVYPIFITATLHEDGASTMCNSDPPRIYQAMQIADAVVAWGIPVVVIGTCNVGIIVTLRNRSFPARQNHKELKSTVRSLQITTTVFLLLNTPIYFSPFIRRMVIGYCGDHSNVSALTALKLFVVETFSEFLYIINFGCDLALYCAASRQFRREVKMMLGEVYSWMKAIFVKRKPRRGKMVRYPTESTNDGESEYRVDQV